MSKIKRTAACVLALGLLTGSIGASACKESEDIPEPTPQEPVRTEKIYDMLTDDMQNPVGIDNPEPVFSWKTSSNQTGWMQKAYRIKVTEGDTTVWNSGKVRSAESVGITYEGDELLSSTEYRWNVTVWDSNDVETVSETATFETGLIEDSDKANVKWISYSSSVSDETVYTIDFDFIIDSCNQGFCFGMQGSGTFVLWQVNTHAENGRVLLRPHFKKNGNWTAYPGGPGNVSATDVTSAVKGSSATAIGKLVHERIEVNGKTVKTYFGENPQSLTLANEYTHSENIPLGNVGFRHCSENNEQEIARYDNITVKNQSGTILYENDFSSQNAGFSGAEYITVEDGMLKVGTTQNAGEQVYLPGSGGLPVYRKSFTPSQGLVSAKLYTSGLGVYESYINGERVGRLTDDGSIEYHELKPGFTEASKRKFYNAYDVTHMLDKNGENAISAVVTSGWWSGLVAANYGNETAYWAKLILKYSNGTTQEIVTDESWKTAPASAVAYADIFNGETYDARIKEDWKQAGFNDSGWSNAKINTEFKGEICNWIGSFVTVREDLELSVKSVDINDGIKSGTADGSHYGTVNVVRSASDGKFTLNKGETALVDFGQNFAGWEAFEAEGEEGTVITVRHGEILNDGNGARSRGCDGAEGSIYNANYRSAKATTKYIMSGNGTEKYHPSFTFYGFRYIEITVDKPVTFKNLTGQVVTSVEKDTGFITTSEEDVNKLISNIRWGQYSNYLSVPTDCPQRDERQGWTADTQVFSQAGCYLGFSKSFLMKFMQDMQDSQRNDGAYPGTAPTGEYNGADWGGTGWADAGIIVPYNLYMFYGDKTVIEENWDSMNSYMTFLSKTNKFGGRPIWGDWLAYESNDDKIREILGVAFYAWDAKLMSKMAEVTERYEQQYIFEDIYRQEKDFFISRYVKPDGTLVRGEQTICLYALYLDLLPDEDSVEAVTNQLISNIERNGNKLQTGFLGTAIIMDTLTKIGRSDVAYSILLQHDNPSWLYSVDQGATTVWERWNSYTVQSGFGDVSMNSFNHYAYGAVASWMFGSMAGISYDEQTPGFRNFIIAPQPDARIDEVKASYDSAYGTVSAESKINGSNWSYKLTLPANTSAEIRLPASGVKVNGKQVSELTLEEDGICLKSNKNGVCTLKAVSGTFEITSVLN